MQRLFGKCCHLVGHFKHSALATDGLIKNRRYLALKTALCCPRSTNKVEQHFLYAIKAAYTPVPRGYND